MKPTFYLSLFIILLLFLVTKIVNNSPHAVAWSVPNSLSQSKLQLSLINKDDNSKTIDFGKHGKIITVVIYLNFI